MEMVSSVPVDQQAITILMMSLFSRSTVCFSVCLRTPKMTKIASMMTKSSQRLFPETKKLQGMSMADS